MYLQQVGRGLRISDGKEKVIILDNVGLFNKFGFPSARRKWKYHFEGKYKGDMIDGQTGLSVTDDDDIRSVFSLEEGDEKVELLHNSKEEIDSMENPENLLLDLSKEFENYLVGKGRQLKTAKDYVRAISNEINDFVRDIVNKQHTSLFHIEDYTKVEEILDSLKSNAGFCEYNKEKHNYMTAALGQYLRFLKHRSGIDSITTDCPTLFNEEAANIEDIKKQLEELESHIKFLVEHGYAVSEKMLNDRD